MASFIYLTDPDRRSERFVSLAHICAVHYVKSGTSPTVSITFMGGENLKLVGAEADQFQASFAQFMHGQTPRPDSAAGRGDQPA